MERREFLQKSGAATLAVAALSIKGYVAPWGSLLRRAEADTGIPLASLKAALDPDECLLLVPTDKLYAKYQTAFNLRTALKPQARVLVRSTRGVQQLVRWLKANKVPFAVRCGGHSFEGLSQSSSVVIDTRLLNRVELDASGQIVTVGGGAALGEVYYEIGKRGLALPAGSCPPVGVSGHTLGGGYGLLGRAFGLACDSLVSAELVDAEGNVRNCSATENQDLFWALRGGGGGSFGVTTQFKFRTHAVKQAHVFGLTWIVPPKRAAALFKAWQEWIQHAPSGITAICRITTDSNGNVNVHPAGQTTGAESELRAELKKLCLEPPQKMNVTAKDILGAVNYFAGGPKQPWPANEKGNSSYFYDQVYMKGKSDYVYRTLSDEGMLALFDGQRRHPGITAIFDGYGGKVSEIAPDATAFFHRKAICSVQYVSQFSATAAATRVPAMKEFHDALAPYFSRETDRGPQRNAYVNYPDSELGAQYGLAYWGDNFERLKKIKTAVDPENLFRHAQSIPTA
jgi:hypothetical protein